MRKYFIINPGKSKSYQRFLLVQFFGSAWCVLCNPLPKVSKFTIWLLVLLSGVSNSLSPYLWHNTLTAPALWKVITAGIDIKNYSGLSLWSGFATSAAESGAEERSIMAMTGHKSTEMVRRYIKEANLFKNNALKNIKF